MIIAQSTSAAEKLAVDTTLDEIRHRVNKETVTTQIDEFIDVISSDGFLDYVNGVGDLPTYSERREHTIKTANVPTLRSYGVPTPDGLRLTTREFEFPEDGRASATPAAVVRAGARPESGLLATSRR